MSGWVDFIGNLAIAVTICLFLSGSQICSKIYKNGLVGDISALPFLTAALNTVIYIIYGIIVGNNKVLIVNAIGFILEVFYLIFYFHYTPNKKKLFHQILFITISALLAVYYAFAIEKRSSTAVNVIGYMGAVFNVIMCGSPLGSIGNVLKTRSTETLSFALCLTTFGTAFLWSVYGYMIDDYFIAAPNMISSVLGFAQLALFVKFGGKKVKPDIMQF